MLENAEIQALVKAVGTGVGDAYDHDRLRYDKIVLMADADVDGGHITTLLLTFFYRLCPELIEKGHLYLAQPPLYQLRKGAKVAYAMSDKERDRLLRTEFKRNTNVEVQRFKGLGEMDAEQLWATTMDPGRRTLLRVNIEDAARADELFVLLMGNQTDPRREWIVTQRAVRREHGRLMATATTTPPPTLTTGQVLDVSLESRMEQAFLDYSMSVIVGRALPDVRDGLKPVQRRILYSMWESGLRPDRPYRKCASAVGEVMKTYHPHGDSSIYDALVRMAQDFSTREPLVDGHGNFGSVDGDPPAAMRYTEARLSPLAMELLAGIDEETVDYVENYDGYATEPVVLPARFPNLLVNGASGIAVGMATNIPPHNLGEVIDAVLHLLRRPDATVDDLMKHVPAPDFPGGARIVDGPRHPGRLRRPAAAPSPSRRSRPPRCAPATCRASSSPRSPTRSTSRRCSSASPALVATRKLDAIRDLRDESSRDGMRIVIELKRGEDPAAVLAKLHKLTDLRTNFNVNLVALVDGAPRTLGLRDVLLHYVDHQREVAHPPHRAPAASGPGPRPRPRGAAARARPPRRGHRADPRQRVGRRRPRGAAERFGMSEIQAQAVLDMQLRRLAALERAALEDEYQELQETIAGLEAILGDRAVLDRRARPTSSRSSSASTRRRAARASSRAGIDDRGPARRRLAGRVRGAGGDRHRHPRRLPQAARPPPRDPGAQARERPASSPCVRATTDDTLLLVDADGSGPPGRHRRRPGRQGQPARDPRRRAARRRARRPARRRGAAGRRRGR